MEAPNRVIPNILITGTPGVGKSRLCKYLNQMLGFKWIDISKVAIENNFLLYYDEDYDCPVLHENLVMNLLEPDIALGGNIVEYYSSDIFPEEWFDVVYVIRTKPQILFNRLWKRGYRGRKLKENVECEINNVQFAEAIASYQPHIVRTLQGSSQGDIENNYYAIKAYVENHLEHL